MFSNLRYARDLRDNPDSLKQALTQYPGNDYIRNMVHHYAEQNPHRKVQFSL